MVVAVDYVPSATDRNSLGVAGYLDEYANRADLRSFLSRYRAEAINATYQTVQIQDGGDDQSDPGVEVSSHLVWNMRALNAFSGQP